MISKICHFPIKVVKFVTINGFFEIHKDINVQRPVSENIRYT
jgi:hypothetical protein